MRYLRINANKFLIIVLCCSVFLTGCFIHLPEPPSKDEIETWFRENREDITLVTKELLQLDCDTCFVTDAYDRVVDYENAWVPIDNQAFFPAVNRCIPDIYDLEEKQHEKSTNQCMQVSHHRAVLRRVPDRLLHSSTGTSRKR